MLQITNIDSGYGKKHILFGLSLAVKKAEIVALIGPNGAGKSTVLKAISGLISLWNGQVTFHDQLLNNQTPAQIVSSGITFVPQGSRVFHDMTVMENFEIGGFLIPKKQLKCRIQEVLEIFPVLRERINRDAGLLSGGEQQILALARALITDPQLLMLDEPSLGLSPNFVMDVFEKILEINREQKVSILIVEQKVSQVLDICHRVYSLKLGRVAYSGFPDELKSDRGKLQKLFL
jgi:branched-chain amino acid transport system ATP-binding protein